MPRDARRLVWHGPWNPPFERDGCTWKSLQLASNQITTAGVADPCRSITFERSLIVSYCSPFCAKISQFQLLSFPEATLTLGGILHSCSADTTADRCGSADGSSASVIVGGWTCKIWYTYDVAAKIFTPDLIIVVHTPVLCFFPVKICLKKSRFYITDGFQVRDSASFSAWQEMSATLPPFQGDNGGPKKSLEKWLHFSLWEGGRVDLYTDDWSITGTNASDFDDFLIFKSFFRKPYQGDLWRLHRWKEGRDFDSQRVTVQIFSWISREGPKAFIYRCLLVFPHSNHTAFVCQTKKRRFPGGEGVEGTTCV